MDKKGVWRVKYITIIHHLINETRSYHLRSSYSDITYSVMKALASWDIFGIDVWDRGGTKQRHAKTSRELDVSINLSPFITNSVTLRNGQQVLRSFHTIRQVKCPGFAPPQYLHRQGNQLVYSHTELREIRIEFIRAR